MPTDVSTRERPDPDRRKRPDPDSRIRVIAARQHGVVSRAQLLEAGVAAHSIEHRLRSGRLVRIHTSVYGVAPVLAARHGEMAAVLRCGPGAALSHASAGVLWRILPEEDAPVQAVPVTVSTIRDVRAPPARSGKGAAPPIRIHRVCRLDPDEVAQRDGIPVTSPGRTLVDLAGVLTRHELERALARADRLGLLDREELERLLRRHPRRRGNARIRRFLRSGASPRLTRSRAEALFMDLVRKAGLREPATNVRLRGWEVDFLWRAERLVVEVDGFEYHSGPAAFERDRRRDAELAAAGLRVVRVTWRQLTERREQVLARLVQALARGAIASAPTVSGPRPPRRQRP